MTRAWQVIPSQDGTGESVVWDDRTGILMWVDIVGKRIHRLHLATNKHEIWPTPDFVPALALRKDGGAIVGLTHEICWWDFAHQFEPFVRPEPDRPRNRINECVVAPDGSYWVGTMQSNLDSEGRPKAMDANLGAYYRITPRGEISRLTDNVYGITNTMIWPGDGRFLTADTLANEIYSFRYDDDSKVISGRSLFAAPFPRGRPDGSCMDEEGFFWNCRVSGGACLVRYAPDGRVDRVVELPCSSPTSCAFGGDDLRTLFVTSSRFEMDPKHLTDNPQEGDLWAVDVEVRGRPCNRFG
jgi:sugar lactone lactonase YvrE